MELATGVTRSLTNPVHEVNLLAVYSPAEHKTKVDFDVLMFVYFQS